MSVIMRLQCRIEQCFPTCGLRLKSGLREPYILVAKKTYCRCPICRDLNWGHQLFLNPAMLKRLGNAGIEHT